MRYSDVCAWWQENAICKNNVSFMFVKIIRSPVILLNECGLRDSVHDPAFD